MSVDRGFTWMDDETSVLIDIWSNKCIQEELNCSKRNFAVFEKIACQMSNMGFNRTAYQCREKVKRLKKEYYTMKECLQKDAVPKKPMKFYERVDSVLFQRNLMKNSGRSSSDEVMEYALGFDSDASDSCIGADKKSTEDVFPIGAETSINDPKCEHTSNTSSVEDKLSENEDADTRGKDSTSTECDVLWAPSVVLVENEDCSGDAVKCFENPEVFDSPTSTGHGSPSQGEEPPSKKRKQDEKGEWLQEVLEAIAHRFMRHQVEADKKFLDRLVSLEEEKIKKDKEMHRMWIDFEERRRREEQQHELNIMMMFGQLLKHSSSSESEKE